MNSGRILVNGSSFYLGNSTSNLCQLALKSDIPNVTQYVHPITKQCNYSYTHPATKQCNWEPESSGSKATLWVNLQNRVLNINNNFSAQQELISSGTINTLLNDVNVAAIYMIAECSCRLTSGYSAHFGIGSVPSSSSSSSFPDKTIIYSSDGSKQKRYQYMFIRDNSGFVKPIYTSGVSTAGFASPFCMYMKTFDSDTLVTGSLTVQQLKVWSFKLS